MTAAFAALASVVVYSESIVFAAIVGMALLTILFVQARHFFDAEPGAAVGLVSCYLLFIAGGLSVAEYLTGPMPWRSFLFKSGDEQHRMFADWSQKGAPSVGASSPTPAASVPAAPLAATPPAVPAVAVTAAAPQPPPPSAPAAPVEPARGAPDLQALYIQLQKARAELDPNDPQAVARFNEQAAAYHQEKAIASAALTVPKAIPVRADSAESAGKGNAAQSASNTGTTKR